MANLEQQIKDWEYIKSLFRFVSKTDGELRRKVVNVLSKKVKSYCEEYQTKYNYWNKPDAPIK